MKLLSSSQIKRKSMSVAYNANQLFTIFNVFFQKVELIKEKTIRTKNKGKYNFASYKPKKS